MVLGITSIFGEKRPILCVTGKNTKKAIPTLVRGSPNWFGDSLLCASPFRFWDPSFGVGMSWSPFWFGDPRIGLGRDTKKIPIIMLTAKSEEDNKIMGLNSGIDDYLTKPFSPKELIARINALLRRSSPELTDEPVNILDLSLDPLQHQLTIKGKLTKIGPTEFKILHLFIKNLNKVFSRNQIMDRVWGNKSEIDDRTVDVHIKRIRACLANDGYDKIIRTIRGEGYSVSEKHL